MDLRNTPSTYEEELENNPELKESDVQKLREWCAKQPHFPKVSDVMLAKFLFHKKFRVEATKTALETYLTMRTHAPELFSNSNFAQSEELRIIARTFINIILKKKTNDGTTIIYIKFTASDPPDQYYNNYLRYVNIATDVWLHMQCSRPSYVVLYNMEHMSLKHLSHLNFTALKKYILYIQEANPMRLLSIHLVKSPPIVHRIVEMIKPFVNNKFMRKIHFHSTTESLEKFIPLDALPNEDGGMAGNMADLMNESVQYIENHLPWFQTEEATMIVNESLRPGKPKTSSDLFGVEGSFKMMNID